MKFIELLRIYAIIKMCAYADSSVIDVLRQAKEKIESKPNATIDKGNVKSVGVANDGQLKGVLVGLSQTTTSTTEKPSLTLPPGYPHDALPPACLDLMIVMDVSCSIKEEDRIKARDFAAELVAMLLNVNLTQFINTRVGLVRYSQTVEQVFKLDDYDDANLILKAIRSMNTSDLGCRTHTHLALEELYKTYFTSELGDRPNFLHPNAAILFTDGRTIARRFAPDTKRQAKNAEVSGIELHVVDVPHRQDLEDLADEFDELPTKPEYLYDVEEQEDIGNIANDLSTRYNCHRPDFGTGQDDPSSGCANVVFGIDVSCSIDRTNVSKAVSVAKDIIDASQIGHKFAAFTYDNNTVSHVPYFTDTSAQLNNLDRANKACKTRTNRAITYAENTYFQNSSTSVLIVFGDGNESPWNENELMKRKARAFKNNKGTLIWVVLTSNRKNETRIRGVEEQIKVTASINGLGTRLVFDYHDPDVATVIANYLDRYFPVCTGSPE